MTAWFLDNIRSVIPSPNLFYLVALSVLLPLYTITRRRKAGGLLFSPDTAAEKLHDHDTKDTDANNTTYEYDVVIIGGGTAGCVLASRLSEDPNLRVLVLEAGGSSRDVLFSRIPSGFSRLFHTKNDYAIITEPQVHAGNVKKYWPRAKLLGGCSAMNALMFHAGSPADYDEWAKTGLDNAKEWSYQALRKYFLKFEKYNPHPDYPDVDLKERGLNGPVNVGYVGYCTQATKKLIKACVNLGIPSNPDVNSPSRGTLGVTKIMTYIDKTGTRVTAESAYLTPEVLKRPNLKIVLYSTVTRIAFNTDKGRKRATAVEFTHTQGFVKTSYRVKVKRELIISAGAVHSPHILMLSGVGPRNELEKHGIPVIHDLPGVGRNLQDHIVAHATFALKPGHSLQHLLVDVTVRDKITVLLSLMRWKLFGSGPLTSNMAESAAFIRSDDPKLFYPDKYTIKDETSGPNAPDIEILMVPVGFGQSRMITHPAMNVEVIVLRPQSNGIVALKSANPFDAPLVDPRYLEKENDIAVLIRGFKLIFRIVKTEPMLSALETENRDNTLFDHDLDKLSDEQLEEIVRGRVQTLYHPTSTCRMARLEDEGVVDARLKIHGLDNVRIVDASIFPRIPAGHTTAPVLAVAEKAADMIKQALA